MRFGIQSWGSEGDNRPLLALAAGLASAGHEVNLVISSIEGQGYSDYAEKKGFGLRQTGSLNYSPEELESMGKQVIAQRNSLSQFRSVLDHLFNPLLEDIWSESRWLCGISDVVIGHFVVYPLSIAAQGKGIPHELVFPRCSGIVHHGGAGTSHTAARSGVPSIVVMFAVDQFYWGSLLVRKGLAAAAIPRRKLTRRKLTDAMLELKENPVFKNNSTRTGSRMKLENGVSKAVEIIEEVIQDSVTK